MFCRNALNRFLRLRVDNHDPMRIVSGMGRNYSSVVGSRHQLQHRVFRADGFSNRRDAPAIREVKSPWSGVGQLRQHDGVAGEQHADGEKNRSMIHTRNDTHGLLTFRYGCNSNGARRRKRQAGRPRVCCGPMAAALAYGQTAAGTLTEL